CAWVPGAADCW
nr:immunoglobulin heavy chain junction region [Macaca mulatta]